MPAFTIQPQSITALWLVLILPSHGGQKAESTWDLHTYSGPALADRKHYAEYTLPSALLLSAYFPLRQVT